MDAQLDLLRSYGREKAFSSPLEFVDVESAKEPGRPAFDEMVAYLKSHPTVKTILCEKTDRLYRNLRDFVTIDDLDVEIHLVKENEVISKNSRSNKKFDHGLKVLMAKKYIDNLSEEVQKGMTTKAKGGTWPSCAPIGYLNVQKGDKRGIDVDSDWAPLIVKVFEWYATGCHSLRSVADMAAEAGLRGRNGKPLSRSRIGAMLKNPFYMGYFRWNGKTYKGDHTPIVSAALFESVQEIFRRKKHPLKPARRVFAYTGLIKCSNCGCAITAEEKKGIYVYYHCTGARGGCKKPSINENDLETLLGELVASVQIDADKANWIKQALRESHQDEKEYHDHQIATLSRRCQRIQDRLDLAYVDKLDGKIDETFWVEKSEAWRREQDQLLTKIGEHKNANRAYFDEGAKIIELAERAYSLWTRQERHKKRKLLDVLLSNCTFDGVKLYPTYRKPFCWLAKGPGRPLCLPKQD